MRLWLHESQGDVKIVLTLAINRQMPEIVIEKWELNDNRPYRTSDCNFARDSDPDVDETPSKTTVGHFLNRPGGARIGPRP